MIDNDWGFYSTYWYFMTKGKILPENHIRVERIDEEIKEKFCIETKLEKQNTSNHDHYSKLYTQETKDLIQNKDRKIIKMFGYRFEKV